MSQPEARRFIGVTPPGALKWLQQEGRSPGRDAIEHLLFMDDREPVNLRAMSARMSQPLGDTARLLFALNREQDIQVDICSPARNATFGVGLAGLDDDLNELAEEGQEVLLASRDGLCIAVAGLSREEAQLQAGRFFSQGQPDKAAHRLSLFFARERVEFFSTRRIDLGHPVWLRIVRRLLRACGPFSPYAGRT